MYMCVMNDYAILNTNASSVDKYDNLGNLTHIHTLYTY